MGCCCGEWGARGSPSKSQKIPPNPPSRRGELRGTDSVILDLQDRTDLNKLGEPELFFDRYRRVGLGAVLEVLTAQAPSRSELVVEGFGVVADPSK